MATKRSSSKQVPAPRTAWKVGELARETGLTERTLRYYDQIGLLRPSQHSEAGYRLYSPADIARLQQIRSLRQLGMSLDEVRAWLDSPTHTPLEAVELQLQRLREQLALQQLLCRRLEALADWLRASAQSPAALPPAQLLIQTIEVMMSMDYNKYYTPEQLAWLQRRAEEIGQERIREVEAEWPQLIAEVKAAMAAGVDPRSEQVQALARRWQALMAEFTAGNPAIEAVSNRMYNEEVDARQASGIDAALMTYVQAALAGLT